MTQYFDITACHVEKGFITYQDRLLLDFNIVENVAIVTGTAEDAAIWAERINAVLMTVEQSQQFIAKLSVPKEVTRRQALQALRINGITEADVEVAINTIQDELQRDLAMIEFRTSQTFERDRPLLIQLCPALGLNEEQRYDLLILAATL